MNIRLYIVFLFVCSNGISFGGPNSRPMPDWSTWSLGELSKERTLRTREITIFHVDINNGRSLREYRNKSYELRHLKITLREKIIARRKVTPHKQKVRILKREFNNSNAGNQEYKLYDPFGFMLPIISSTAESHSSSFLAFLASTSTGCSLFEHEPLDM